MLGSLGEQAARRWFITAERFDAAQARAMGFVHELCASEALDATVDELVAALVANGLSVAEYTALQLKKAVVGYGRADKAQMQEMVKRLLQLPGLPGKDAADALGLCITHAQVARSVAAINKVSALQARTHAAYKGGRSY